MQTDLKFRRYDPAEPQDLGVVYLYLMLGLPFYVGESHAQRVAGRHADHVAFWKSNRHTFLRREFYNFPQGDNAPAAFVARLRHVLASADRPRFIFINGIDPWTAEVAAEANAFCTTESEFLVASFSGTASERKLAESRVQQDLKNYFDGLIQGGVSNWCYTSTAEVFGKQEYKLGRPELNFAIDYTFDGRPACQASEFFAALPGWLKEARSGRSP